MQSMVLDLVFSRKPNLTNTSVGSLIKIDRVMATEELTPKLVAAITSAFFSKLEEGSIGSSEPVTTIINELKSKDIEPAKVNDCLAVLAYYGYEFLIINRVDLNADVPLDEMVQARGYLLLKARFSGFSVPCYANGWGTQFNSIPTYPVALQAICDLMALPSEFQTYTPILDNREFFADLRNKGQTDFYDNRDAELFMNALGYEYLMLA